ncbi:LuxR C-terminal-related transcriptional regulator [Specibacter cremeus]|uniref:LuxR C-terminal-related transcriptional regulator n=1 Tax=Specibacter cremeus TaxID=1629051 RepID=UPI0013DDE653|nr:LuxR C-terminal-related transcriptional regulator [Specibacter cremeus]
MAAVAAVLADPKMYGAALIGPPGVGKSTMAHQVAAHLADAHVVRLFGSPLETTVPYGALSLLMARLPAAAAESAVGTIHGIADLLRAEAADRDVLLVLDDLPSIDTMSMGVVMHLLMSRSARLLVLARDASDLPEDLVWLVRDGLLDVRRLANFTRAEVGTLLRAATTSPPTESALTALFEATGGNPLVVHAVFNELVANGNLSQHLDRWVINGPINLTSASALTQIVRSRLSRETEVVRLGVEKMALMQRAPLSLVLSVLGAETMSALEERGYLNVSEQGRQVVSLRERHLAEIVRGWLDPARKVALFRDITEHTAASETSLDVPDTLALAAWAHDAGLPMEPEFALAAARMANFRIDPLLALRCVARVPRESDLWLGAVHERGRAYNIMADYERAVHELEAVSPEDLARASLADGAAWAASLCSALLWVPGGYDRIPAVLAAAETRLVRAGTGRTEPDGAAARRHLRLAHCELMLHLGRFAEIVDELEEGARFIGDEGFRLNCASMLVVCRAVLGRELEAIELARRVAAEVTGRGVHLGREDYYNEGLVLGLIWTGQWRACVDLLADVLTNLPYTSQYRGGVVELALGIAHTYAGRGAAAVEVLLAAAAQLEVRETSNFMRLAYTGLAFAHAQIHDEDAAMSYLALAERQTAPTAWVNRAISSFFQQMALRWLDHPAAVRALLDSAQEDIAAGRVATASMSLFGATIHAGAKELAQLEETSLRRQGPMADVNVLLARSIRTRDPKPALEAARIAGRLELLAVESRCAVTALDLAREAGNKRLGREAQDRLDRLRARVVVLPLTPGTEGGRLTQREIQVARLAERGLGNRAIAERIGVSVRTVEGHLYQIFAKLGITSRQELENLQDP